MQHRKGVVGRGLLRSAATLLVAALAPEMRAQTLTHLPVARLECLQEPPTQHLTGRQALEAVFFAAGPDYDPVLPINNERALVQADEDGGVDGAGAASSPTRSSGSERERQ